MSSISNTSCLKVIKMKKYQLFSAIISILIVVNIIATVSIGKINYSDDDGLFIENQKYKSCNIDQNEFLSYSEKRDSSNIIIDTKMINTKSTIIEEVDNNYQFTLINTQSKITGISDISSITVNPSNPDETDNFFITAEITDSSGILSASISYKINSGSVTTENMLVSSGDDWSSGLFGSYSPGTLFEYVIIAQTGDFNFLYYPGPTSTNYASITITSSDSTPPTITSIQYSPTKPYPNETITISATITDASGIQSANLHYSINSGSFTSTSLSNSGSNYFKNIGPYTAGTTIEYYITASDNSYNHNTRTANNGGSNYHITVVEVDNTGPSITNIAHSPSDPTELDEITFSADITDSSGILSANLYLRVNSGSWANYALSYSGDTYSIELGPYIKGSNLDYFFVAIDDSRINNEATNDNSNNYYSFYIEDSDLTDPEITNIRKDPSTVNDLDSVLFSVDVYDISSISSVTLNLRINSGSFIEYSMSLATGITYEVERSPFTAGDIIYYYITAIDNSLNFNEATDNNSGMYYSFSVQDSDNTEPSITNVYNDPLYPTELDDIYIFADIQDASGIQLVTLYYRINSGSWNSVDMTLYNVTQSQYRVNIGKWNHGSTIEYYITATDNSLNNNIALEDNGGLYYSIFVNDSDNDPPNVTDISHDPVNPTEFDNITISLTATDSSNINFVDLQYKVNNGSWISLSMTPISANLYRITINSFTESSIVYYQFILDDASLNNNTILFDNAGVPFQIEVIKSDESAPSITNIIHTPNIAVINEVITVNTTIIDSNGIKNATLYYRIIDGSWIAISMINMENDVYSANIGPFLNSTTVSYYIEAYDLSVNNNLARNNRLSLYYNIKVIEYTDAIIEVDSIDPIGFDTWIIRIHDEDRNINDSTFQTVSITIISMEDPIGITVELFETTSDSGIFVGTIIFDIEDNLDSLYPLLLVSNGKAFILYYDEDFNAEGDSEMLSYLYTWYAPSSAVLKLDSDKYYTGDNATITLIDSDLNLNEYQIDIVTVYIWSTIDRTGFKLVLTETSIDTAVFTGTLFFNEAYTDSSENQINVRGSSGFYVYYEDLNNEYDYKDYLLLTAGYSSTIEPALVITTTYYPELPENGDSILIYAGLSTMTDVNQVFLVDLQTNEEILMEFSYSGTYETYFSAWLNTNVTEGELRINYQIKIIFTDESTVLNEINLVDLATGQLSVEIKPLTTTLIAEIEIIILDKRDQLLKNTDLLITATHQTSGETKILHSGIIINGKYILVIDSELNLAPGYWIIEVQSSKYGYNDNVKNFSVTIGLGIEIYPGENYIQENGMSIYIVAEYHFWLVIEFIPIPLDLEISDGYILLEETFVRLSIINSEVMESMPVSEFNISFDVNGIDPKEIIVFHKALNLATWSEINTEFNQQDFTLSFNVSTLGDFGVSISKYLVPEISNATGFTLFDILNLVLILSVIHILRKKK